MPGAEVIVLERSYDPERLTHGVLHAYHGTAFQVIELPWRGNQPNVSCIPEGRYQVERDFIGRHKWFRVVDVPGRSAIEFHGASQASHLKGCVGFLEPGTSLLALAAMMPASDVIWIRSDTGPPPFTMEV